MVCVWGGRWGVTEASCGCHVLAVLHPGCQSGSMQHPVTDIHTHTQHSPDSLLLLLSGCQGSGVLQSQAQIAPSHPLQLSQPLSPHLSSLLEPWMASSLWECIACLLPPKCRYWERKYENVVFCVAYPDETRFSFCHTVLSVAGRMQLMKMNVLSCLCLSNGLFYIVIRWW